MVCSDCVYHKSLQVVLNCALGFRDSVNVVQVIAKAHVHVFFFFFFFVCLFVLFLQEQRLKETTMIILGSLM